MDKIKVILDAIEIPEPCFELSKLEDNIIFFKPLHDLKLPETSDELTKLVYEQVARYHQMPLDYERIIHGVQTNVRSFHINLWMQVNKKTSWTRCKLKKSISYANSDKFKKLSLELFLDATKYGITPDSIKNKSEIKSMHKFIATRFEAMVEAECPR